MRTTLLNSAAGVSALRAQVRSCVEELPKAHAPDHVEGLTLQDCRVMCQCSADQHADFSVRVGTFGNVLCGNDNVYEGSAALS